MIQSSLMKGTKSREQSNQSTLGWVYQGPMRSPAMAIATGYSYKEYVL